MKKRALFLLLCIGLTDTKPNIWKKLKRLAVQAYEKAKHTGQDIKYALHLEKKQKPYCTDFPDVYEPAIETENQNDPYIQAIQKYAPIMYLHKNEKAFPMSAQAYLQHPETKIVQQNNHRKSNKAPKQILLDKGQAIPTTIAQLAQTHAGQSDIFVEIADCVTAGQDPKKHTDAQGNLTTTAYVKVDPVNDQGKAYITYIFFYGLNFPYQLKLPISNIPLPPGEILNEHECDIEHIVEEFDVSNNELVLSRIFYAAHGSAEGLWFDILHPENNSKNEHVTFEDHTHPIVYIAKGGHGCYPQPGNYVRIFGFANDETNKDMRWTPNWVLIRSPQDPAFNTQKDGWILLPGDMGPRGVGALAQQKWFKDVRSELSNGSTKNRHFCSKKGGLQGTAEYELCLRKKAFEATIPKK